MSQTRPVSRSDFGRGGLALLGLGAVAALIALPWWRNHALLRDFYDYGLVIAASGRMALGERPYVDFTTPIQLLHFLQARAAERIFGPHYLSLTYANLLLIVAAFFGMVAALVRPFGWRVAILLAAAVVTASVGQHTIVWHNAMGTIWVSLVVWLTAASPTASGRRAVGRLALVCVLLWLGGMTKITYQITALAFAGLFALRNGWTGVWAGRRVALELAAYGFFGVVVPVATELGYTGASLAQWWQNVIVTPGGRVGLVGALTQVGFYLRTPHDYYHPLFMPFVGAWGGAVLLALAALVVRRLRGRAAPRSAWWLLGALLAGAWICAGVLQATNFDIAYVAGATWLALGAALGLALLAEPDGRVSRAGRVVVAIAAITLLVPAWQAAWRGTRALWGPAVDDRTTLVTTNDLPPCYDYFRGMRITPSLHESLAVFAREQGNRPGGEFYFINGTEFMLRAFPGQRLPGLPLWLHEGTTYDVNVARQIQARLALGEIRQVVSHGDWNVWRHGTEWYLQTGYHYERMGPLFHVYRALGDPRQTWRNPATFAAATDSSAYEPDLTTSGGPFTLCRASSGPGYLGTPRSGRLIFRVPLGSLSGELVARRAPDAGQSPLDMVWRLVVTEPNGAETVLRDERLILAPNEPERIVPFHLAVGGKPAALELFLPPDERIEAGFRHLETEYPAGPAAALPDLMAGEPAVPQSHQETWAAALFADARMRQVPCQGTGFGTSPNQSDQGPELFVHTPGVVWFPLDGNSHRMAGEFGLGAATWTNPGALNGVRAQVIFYRAGHLQVLLERELRPKERPQDRAPQPFEVALPSGEGWIALVFTALDSPRNTYGHSWWRKVRVW